MCLARQEEGRISLLFIQNNATFQREGGIPTNNESTRIIRQSLNKSQIFQFFLYFFF
jgi:hypothetical protein